MAIVSALWNNNDFRSIAPAVLTCRTWVRMWQWLLAQDFRIQVKARLCGIAIPTIVKCQYLAGYVCPKQCCPALGQLILRRGGTTGKEGGRIGSRQTYQYDEFSVIHRLFGFKPTFANGPPFLARFRFNSLRTVWCEENDFAGRDELAELRRGEKISKKAHGGCGNEHQ